MPTEGFNLSSSVTGNAANPTNALGAVDSLYAGGPTNANTSWTHTWQFGNPTITTLDGTTQTVTAYMRKGTNSGNPSYTINVIRDGSTIATASGTVTSSARTGYSASWTSVAGDSSQNIQIQVVITGVGGSGSVRNSAEIDYALASLTTAEQAVNATFTTTTGSSTATAGEGALTGTANVTFGLDSPGAGVLIRKWTFTEGLSNGTITVPPGTTAIRLLVSGGYADGLTYPDGDIAGGTFTYNGETISWDASYVSEPTVSAGWIAIYADAVELIYVEGGRNDRSPTHDINPVLTQPYSLADGSTLHLIEITTVNALGETGALTGTVTSPDATFSTTNGSAAAAGVEGALTGTANATFTTTSGGGTDEQDKATNTYPSYLTYTVPEGTTSIVIRIRNGGRWGQGTLAYTGQAITYRVDTGSGGTLTVRADSTDLIYVVEDDPEFPDEFPGFVWFDTTRLTSRTEGLEAGADLIRFTATLSGGTQATAGGGSGAFTGTSDATFTTTTGSVPAAAGTGALTGTRTATFTTTTGTAPAAGVAGSMSGTALLTTTFGSVAAAGGTGALTGTVSATFGTTAGSAAAAAGQGAFTGTATLTTTEGSSAAAGSEGALTGSADSFLTTTVGDAAAAGETGALSSGENATFGTTTGDAPAAGEFGILIPGATLGGPCLTVQESGLTVQESGLTVCENAAEGVAGGESGTFTGAAGFTTLSTQWIGDDFQRPSSTDLGADWVEVSGDWSIADNAYLYAPPGNGVHVRHVTATLHADQWGEVDVNSGTGAPSIILRYTDADNYVWGLAGTVSNQIWKRVSGVETMLANVGATIFPATLRFEAVGSTFTLYRNGTQVAQATDATAPASGLYVGTRNNSTGSRAQIQAFRAGTLVPVQAPAAGGTGSMSGTTGSADATLTTTTGDAAAAGGTGALTAPDATLATTGGDATAAGGSGALSATSNGDLTTTLGTAVAAGGAGAFVATGEGDFTTLTGQAVAQAGSGALLSPDARLTTTLGTSVGAGGAGALTGGATLGTTTGSASAAGGSGALAGGATLGTATAGASAGAGSGSLTGAASFGTTTGDAGGAGGSGTSTGTGTFGTTAAVAAASGGTGALVGTAVGTFGTLTGPATAAAGSGALRSAGSFTTTGGTAAAGAGSGTLTAGATFGTTGSTAAGSGGSTLLRGDATLLTTAAQAQALAQVGALTGGGSHSGTGGTATAGGGASQHTADALFEFLLADALAEGWNGNLIATNPDDGKPVLHPRVVVLSSGNTATVRTYAGTATVLNGERTATVVEAP